MGTVGKGVILHKTGAKRNFKPELRYNTVVGKPGADFSSPMAKLGSKTCVILCPRVGALFGHQNHQTRGSGWCSNSPVSSCCVCYYVQKGPGDWQPRSLAPRLDVCHLCRNSGSSIRMPWHSSAPMWAHHLCCRFPASRNKWGPHDANPDLGSVQVTDVWGG